MDTMDSRTFDEQLESIIDVAQKMSIICDPRFKRCFSETFERLQILKKNQFRMEDERFHYDLFDHLESFYVILNPIADNVVEKMCFHLMHGYIYELYHTFGSLKYDKFDKLTQNKMLNPRTEFEVCNGSRSIKVKPIEKTFFGKMYSARESNYEITWIFYTLIRCLLTQRQTHQCFLDKLNNIVGGYIKLSIDQVYDLLELILKNMPQFKSDILFNLATKWTLRQVHDHISRHGFFTLQYIKPDDIKPCLTKFVEHVATCLNEYYIKRSNSSVEADCQLIYCNDKTFELAQRDTKLETETFPCMVQTNISNFPITSSHENVVGEHQDVKLKTKLKIIVPVKLSVGRFDKITIVPLKDDVIFEIEESETSTKCGDLIWFKLYLGENIIPNPNMYFYYEYNKKQYAIWQLRDLTNGDFKTRLNKFLKTHSDMLKESGHYDVFSKLV